MEYNCKYFPINKLILNENGDMESLCTKCKSQDCSNPIEKRKISILGIIKEARLFVRGTEPMIVIQCEGYVDEK